ncbi:MAG: hypothetical protein U0Q11_04720 [Vicinamibacterales bacterium]
MTDPQTPHDPVVALGYTPREADFLRLVARYGGYFVMRQYCAALGRERGSTTAAFARTLLRRKDATQHTFCRTQHVWHLAPRRLYAAAGVGADAYRRRPRPAAAITARLMALDYVLDHPQFQYLGTDDEWGTYLEGRGVDRLWWPQQRYHGHRATVPRVRYFVDAGPLAIARDPVGAERLVVAFLDDAPQTAVSFARFLAVYRGLFAQLPTWQVVFVTQDRSRLDAARRTFDRDRATAVAFPYDAGALEIFEEYARLRQAFDRKQWSTLQKVGLDRLSVLRRVYVDAHWERLYGQWEQRGPAVVTAASAPPTHPSSTGVFDGYVVPHSYAATQAVRGPR